MFFKDWIGSLLVSFQRFGWFQGLGSGFGLVWSGLVFQWILISSGFGLSIKSFVSTDRLMTQNYSGRVVINILFDELPIL